jgi:hypothetical protein
MVSFAYSLISLGQAVVGLGLAVHSVYLTLNVFRSGMTIPELPSFNFTRRGGVPVTKSAADVPVQHCTWLECRNFVQGNY